MEEIIALIIGLIIYVVLGKKDKKKRQPEQGPTNVAPPIPPKPDPRPEPIPEPIMEDEYDDDDEEEEEDDLRQQPVSFEELLAQFGQAEKKSKSPEKVRAITEQKYGTDDRFMSVAKKIEEKESRLAELYKETGARTHSIMTEDDLKDGHSDNYKILEKGRSRYMEMLSNPQKLRDAFILKEVLDRKHFDW